MPGGLVARRALLQQGFAIAAFLLPQPPAPALAMSEPYAEAVAIAKQAFSAFDKRQLPLAESLFTRTIDEWRRLDRGVEELTALLVARAGVRTDLTHFTSAKADLDEAIALMAPTGEKSNGIGAYREYPDAYVQRGLANEGLRNWRGALRDYDKAVSLWGGVGDGVNPFALTYRARAKVELADYEGALADYRTADSIFSRVDRNVEQASFARAGEAVTLYGLGRRDEAVRIAKQVTTRFPGLTDLHVLMAADAWERGEREQALKEWTFACDVISTGCAKYRDVQDGGWLIEVRRWPSPLVERQRRFLSESRGGVMTSVSR
jgi:tetratricopeptide (TPR) repeat protein